MSDTIKILSCNVDSIVSFNRRADLHDMLLNNNIDIGLIQETKLDDGIKFCLAGYNVFRNDFKRGQAGTAIFIKNSIPYRNHFFSNSINVLINNNWEKFTSCYCPP